MHIVIAMDKFAGTLSAPEAVRAVTTGWLRTAPGDTVTGVPMSDGGPGFLDSLADAFQGRRRCGERLVTVTGPAGVGKSTVAMQYVVTAISRGQKGAVYVFDEVLGTMIERTEKLCLAKEGCVRAYIREGKLHAQQIDPAEMSAGAFSGEPAS